MPKGQKSSASSATRKKHARKAAGGSEQQLPLPKEKKKDKTKGKNKEPRTKVYIPPYKPPPVRPDPLDSLGIGKQLPPDLLVVLRRLGKKDSTTKCKAMDDMQEEWINKAVKGDDAELRMASLLTSMPVWLHHVPALFLHSSRKVRLLSATVHTSLLRIPAVRDHVLFFLQESGDPNTGNVLGSWCMAAYDIDRQVAAQARRSLDVIFPISSASTSALSLDESTSNLILDFAKRALFYPLSLYADLNPVQPAFVSPPLPSGTPPRGKGSGKRLGPVPAPKPSDDDTQTRKHEEEEESEGDQKGRLRVGALGILKFILDKHPVSESLLDLLSSSSFWSSLYHGNSPPFCSNIESSEGLGESQPVVRKTAWSILLSLVKGGKVQVVDLLPTLSSAVLRSAWVESDLTVQASMWEPMLTFLTQFPTAWTIDRNSVAEQPQSTTERGDGAESDEEDVDSDSSDNADDAVKPSTSVDPAIPKQSLAFREFLQFLQLGCYGSPIQGYPTVMIILSTLPSSILGTNPDSWADLLISFWAAIDGRALSTLERATSSAAFLSSLLECLIFLMKRTKATFKDASEADILTANKLMMSVASQQIARAWEELVSHRLRVDPDASGKILARTLGNLEVMDSVLHDGAWQKISSSVLSNSKSPSSGARFSDELSLLSALQKYLDNATNTSHALIRLVLEVADSLIDQSETNLKNTGEDLGISPSYLSEVLEKFGPIVCDLHNQPSRLDNLLVDNLNQFLTFKPELIVVYLWRRNDVVTCSSLWLQVLKNMAENPTLLAKALPQFLNGAERGVLPTFLKPNDDELDTSVGKVLAETLSGRNDAMLPIVRGLLATPGHFLPRRSVSGLFHTIVYALSEGLRILSHEHSTSPSLRHLQTPLELILSTIRARPEVVFSEDVSGLLPHLFVFSFILSDTVTSTTTDTSAIVLGRETWNYALTVLGSEDKGEVYGVTRSMLRDIITDIESRASPAVILQNLEKIPDCDTLDILKDLFPHQHELDELLSELPHNPLDPTLVIVDPLIPPRSLWKIESPHQPQYDSSGFSEYARIVTSLISVATTDRILARENPWLLRHFLTLSMAAADCLSLPSVESAFFSQNVSPDILHEIVSRTQALTSFLLTDDVADDNWRSLLTAFIQGVTSPENPEGSQLSTFVMNCLSHALQDGSIRESRVLYTIVKHLLNGAAVADAEQWILLARRLEKQAPHASCAVILAVTESGFEPPGLVRYRNEAAAGVFGTSASKANTEGLLLLRRLVVCSPDPDSDIVFLPQNRAVNFMKNCQSWQISDEDIDEDVDCEMTLVFISLAPILQNIPGAHWEFIFDVVETNLETCSFTDSSTLPLLSRTLRLLLTIQDLASTNKALRNDWEPREVPILTLVRDLVQDASVKPPSSTPHAECWILALSIVQDLPASLIDHTTLQKMAHLLLDPSPEVAKMSYILLQDATRKWTEYLVIEAGVDTSETTRYELPPELLQVLQTALEMKDDQPVPNTIGFLLGWMLIFDLFKDTSLRVKMGYAGQLRDLGLIELSFLPFIFDLLDVSSVRNKSFPLEMWSVEEFYVQLYDENESWSPRLLAAHLYYRALLNVPSLISSWWSDCKNRQLSMAVATLTTKHYSPVLIAAELYNVKDPDNDELKGENWAIKVASGIGEVTASYTIDEQEMEIAVRLPPDYPLHSIEVREVRKLGVEENRWRGWLLAVQQIITSQNGRIVDGLSMFKKNVTHHFENQTECAICYSIISVTELSLPKKRCRTCKNSFHAGCLFKWFNTSHTSSCPLCRSDFT